MAITSVGAMQENLYDNNDDEKKIQYTDNTNVELSKVLAGDGSKEVEGEIKYKEPTDEELLAKELPEATAKGKKYYTSSELLKKNSKDFKRIITLYNWILKYRMVKGFINTLAQTHRTKNDDGTITKTVPLLDEKGNVAGKREIVKKLNNNNKTVIIFGDNRASKTNKSNDQPLAIIDYTFNKDGNPMTKCTYDEAGNVMSIEEYSLDGKLTVVYEYDKNDNLTTKKNYEYEPVAPEDDREEATVTFDNGKTFYYLKVTETNMQTNEVTTY